MSVKATMCEAPIVKNSFAPAPLCRTYQVSHCVRPLKGYKHVYKITPDILNGVVSPHLPDSGPARCQHATAFHRAHHLVNHAPTSPLLPCSGNRDACPLCGTAPPSPPRSMPPGNGLSSSSSCIHHLRPAAPRRRTRQSNQRQPISSDWCSFELAATGARCIL